ncbi:ABC transporter ATP-binding protein [Aestuariirhabdus litorea]|uniref:ABC transporter ATP-binding protein n=1 Tax=Aestuariirhabdus litorea TaxID=2528527 RepID=A0A3P3VPJ4_9GAMM|nr:ABC transporter ATP-binding protein [Aestuariirhabdus litorea]RRJ84691.1 ABC transporter ATP-binding protein [Aestuariirhabdus litorea]RWW97916.1 ATP-binding cassette domain-containing protein [Endozoicomonadaceae bacterium GTF-13]
MHQSDIPDLECRSLSKRFGDFEAVKNLSFTIEKGSFFSILGPSGCGKTTLLRMLAGFESPDNGDILIRGRSVTQAPPNHRPVNMVFQHLALFPNMNVADNIGYGLRRRNESASTIRAKVAQVLERIELAGSGEKTISQLSGGQKQRVAIARCLVLEPDLLLLDEPLGALDLKLREQMKLELKRVQAQFGTTFVYITHDQSEALVMSDRVAVMNAGEFEQIAPPEELYHRPQTPFVASFVGDTNRLEGVVSASAASHTSIETPVGQLCGVPRELVSGETVSLFIRPEFISVLEPGTSCDNQLEVRVESLIFDGARSQLLVTHPALKETISLAYLQGGERSLAIGQAIRIGWMKKDMLIFPLDGATHGQT